MPIGACFDTQGVLIHGLCLFGVSSRNGGDAGDIAALPQLRIIWNAHSFKAYLASDMEWYFADAHTNSRNSAEVLRLKFLVLRLRLVPLHKLRHAKRACFYIRFNVCASAS